MKPRLALWLIPLMASVVCAPTVRADESACFDFASPTLEQVFQTRSVGRLLIALRFSGINGQLAGKALSRQAARHGVEVKMVDVPRDLPAQEMAAKQCRANQAQMIAIVEISTGAEPVTATVELRDQTGQPIAALASLLLKGAACSAAEAAAAQPVQIRQGTFGASSDKPMLLPRVPPEHKWYGWESIPGDVASLFLFLGFMAAPQLAAATPVTYLVIPAAVHFGNGQPARAYISLGIRLALPLAGLGLGLTSDRSSCDKEELSGLCREATVVAPVVLGALLAMIIDDAAIAWKPVRAPDPTPERRPTRKPPGVSLGLGVLPNPHGGGLSLAGRF